jgi:hypothetical protein
MVDAVLSTADLLRATGYESVGAMRRCLERQGVRLFDGKDGPWTTNTLINAAKLETRVEQQPGRYSPEML